MIAKAALFALCVAIFLAGAVAFDPPRRADPLLIRMDAPDAYLCVRVAKVPVSVAIGGEPETPALVTRRPDAESIGEYPHLTLCLVLEALP